ncbi:MAG: hypothetical protein WBC91_24125 [Phototrophicaceae bacterium]
MIRVRQVEIEALTFSQYDNGVSEIVYHESTERAVNGFFHFVNMVIKETPPSQTIYLLSDLTQTGHLPLRDHYAKIAKLNTHYHPDERPNARFANIYPAVTLKQKLILEFMRSLDMPNVALDMFAAEERNRAIAWLLSV